MPVQWGQMKSTIQQYLEAGKYDLSGTYSIDNTVRFIITTYKSFVTGQAEDTVGNRILVFEPTGLEQSLRTALRQAFNTPSNAGTDIINSTQTTQGIIIDWPKSTIDMSIPHPGTYIPVSNVITDGGQPFRMFLSYGGNRNRDELAENIVNALQQNALTVRGIYTGIAIGTGPSFPPTPAAPIPVPWVGIK